ncbi:DUF1460 domain-containing protein [Bombella sp. ESL0385]|nr:DUF1460 domain-containing protein [Bombella sp. ESL0385]
MGNAPRSRFIATSKKVTILGFTSLWQNKARVILSNNKARTILIKRRAFLTTIGVGGLGLCQTASAKQRHHHAQPHHHIPPSDAPPLTALSEATRQQISQLIAIAPHRSRQERIVLMSQFMKGTPYLAQPLIGSATTQEELILSWRGVNCMTFVEIILAASRSFTVEQFIHALIATRYRHHHVTFTERRHFYSDWLYGTPILCRDLSPHFPYAQHISKTLNLKLPPTSPANTAPEDRYLPGIPLKKRLITYLPTKPLLDNLHHHTIKTHIKSGDVIGIYSPLPGLDVFHIGLAIWRGHELLFRNASSLPEHRYVVDTPLADYLKERRGIVLYRPIL